jgi:hypothetical protein
MQSEGELHFDQMRPHDQYAAPERALVLRFHDVLSEPLLVTLDENPLNTDPKSRAGWFEYELESRLLTVHLPRDPGEFGLVVE